MHYIHTANKSSGLIHLATIYQLHWNTCLINQISGFLIKFPVCPAKTPQKCIQWDSTIVH